MTHCPVGKALIAPILWVLSISVALAAPPSSPQKLRLVADEWLDTPHGYRLRQSRPRVLLTPKQLRVVIDRMYGPNAREPYKTWFIRMRTYQDSVSEAPYSLMGSALLYRTTGDVKYKNRFLVSIPTTGMPTTDELYSWDLMWNEISHDLKVQLMQRVADAGPHSFYWTSTAQSSYAPEDPRITWGYHIPLAIERALAYSGLFAYTDLEANKDPELLPFDANNFIAILKYQLSDEGGYYNIENRMGGDPTNNSALPGSFGGMYDTFGYDNYNQSRNPNIFQQYRSLTGIDRSAAFVRDAARGTFYQNLGSPYLVYKSLGIPRQIDTWNTGTTTHGPRSDNIPLFAAMYQDGRAQWYATEERLLYTTSPTHRNFMWLFYYDDTITPEPPSTNPTAMYFNGPGLVPMRENWEADAAVGMLYAGEGISRRYEDANTFILGRKVDVVVNPGARLDEGGTDWTSPGWRYTWYSMRSHGRNTIQIYDPNECHDLNRDGTTGALHSGKPWEAIENYGQQIMAAKTGSAFPLDIRERADITKYEHNPEEGYTYTVGDATSAYTKKIDLFEREFLLIRPDVFIIFDRINSTNPNFKKVWRIHTVDEPVASGTPDEMGLGMKAHRNGAETVISNANNVTYLTTLLPKENKLVIRGGDTVLVTDQSLNHEMPISSSSFAISELDTSRILDVHVAGSNIAGSLTIFGDTEDEKETSETITFASDLVHKNSTKYWKRVTNVYTSDMNLNNLTISVPHYYDAENAAGQIFSFAPTYDGTHRSHYRNSAHDPQARWNLSVEATEPNKLDNFLNVFALKDPGAPKPEATLLEGDGVSGVLVDSFFAIFANDRGNIQAASVTLPKQGSLEGLFLNLEPNTDYFYRVTGNQVDISRSASGGTKAKSSAMGTLKADILIE